MFIDEETMGGYYSLREEFLKDLRKEIQKWSYKENESVLRETLMKRMDSGELF